MPDCKLLTTRVKMTMPTWSFEEVRVLRYFSMVGFAVTVTTSSYETIGAPPSLDGVLHSHFTVEAVGANALRSDGVPGALGSLVVNKSDTWEPGPSLH